MSFLLGLPIFSSYVKFQGCNPFKHLSAAPKNAPSPPATIAPPFQGVHATPLGGELYGVNHPRPWRSWLICWLILHVLADFDWFCLGHIFGAIPPNMEGARPSPYWAVSAKFKRFCLGQVKLLDVFLARLLFFSRNNHEFWSFTPQTSHVFSSCPQLFRMTHLSQNRFVPTFMPFRQRRRFWCRQGSWGKKSPAVPKVTKGRPQKLRYFPEKLFWRCITCTNKPQPS